MRCISTTCCMGFNVLGNSRRKDTSINCVRDEPVDDSIRAIGESINICHKKAKRNLSHRSKPVLFLFRAQQSATLMYTSATAAVQALSDAHTLSELALALIVVRFYCERTVFACREAERSQ